MATYKNGKGHEDNQSDEGTYELINLNSISIDGGLKPSGKFIEDGSDTLLENDLVMVLSDVGHGDLLGRVAIIPENNRFVLNQRVALLRINDDTNPYFLFSIINRHQDYFKKLGAGSSQLNISRGTVEDFVVDYPCQDEQRKIAKCFQNLDTLITLHQRKYEKLQMIKKSMLEKMFPQNGEKKPEIRFEGFTDDWEQRKLGDLVINHNAGIYISKEDYGTGTNVIGVGNIYDNDIFDGEIYRLGPVNDEKFLLEENDLIYGESSLVPEGIARTVCVGKNGVGSAFAWHTRRVKLDQSVINSHFATLELNYNIDVRKYLISVSTQTALTGMTTEGYFGVTLSLPTVEEQAHISSLFKQLDHLITLHQRKLEKLRNIKKSMLEKMFV